MEALGLKLAGQIELNEDRECVWRLEFAPAMKVVFPPVLLSGAGSKRCVSALAVRVTESPKELGANHS